MLNIILEVLIDCRKEADSYIMFACITILVLKVNVYYGEADFCQRHLNNEVVQMVW